MLVARCMLASLVLLVGIALAPGPVQAEEASANVLDGIHWVGPPVSLETLRGKTVVVVDYATWCPICNKWSGEFCKQLKESIADKPVVVLAINNDQTPANVKPYLEARDFLAPNIVHGYDPAIAKRNGLPDLWGFMMIDPAGKVVEKGHAGSFFGGDAAKQFVLPKKIREQSSLGEFMVIDAKMSEAVKNTLWPMELGLGTAPDFRKFKGDEKEEIAAALTKYGAKALEKIHDLAEGDVESQFAAYEQAAALGVQLKGTDSAKEARKVAIKLEGNAKFKREFAAKKAFDRCDKLPSGSSKRAAALKSMARVFDGTLYGAKAKEAGASVASTAGAGK